MGFDLMQGDDDEGPGAGKGSAREVKSGPSVSNIAARRGQPVRSLWLVASPDGHGSSTGLHDLGMKPPGDLDTVDLDNG
ncbi:unnamed protein product [Arctogadus glacialis]